MNGARLIMSVLALVLLGWTTRAGAGEASSPASPVAEMPGSTPVRASAQPTLSLQEVIALALERNRDLAVERASVEVAAAAVLRAEGAYDPVFRAESKYRWQKLPSTWIFSGAPPGELTPSSGEMLGLASVSRLFASGATASVSTSVARDTTTSVLTLVEPAYVAALGIELRQPLLQNRAIDAGRRGIRVARADRRRADAALERVVLDTIAAVERAYWTLVAADQEVAARASGLKLAEAQRDDTAVRIEAGIASESDLAQPVAEIERRRGELLAAQEARTRADLALKALILDTPDDPLWSVPIQPSDAPPSDSAAPAPDAALRLALSNRPELRETASRLERQAVEIDAARDRLRPQLDLVASYTLRGLAGGQSDHLRLPFPGAVPPLDDRLGGNLVDAWGNLVLHRFPDATLGVALALPLGQRSARADLAAAEAGRRQVEALDAQLRQRIGIEVRTALAALETARQRLAAAEAQRRAAETQLQAEQDRYDAGASTLFLVLTRQNDLTLARVTEAGARADHARALTAYARAVGTLLADRGVHLERTGAGPAERSVR
jgi:HAE1 family hydrophobic/amphiphilic exporter-1